MDLMTTSGFRSADESRSSEVQSAIAILGNETSVELLKYLRGRTHANQSAILRETGINRSTLAVQLNKLEASGCITGDVPQGQRVGKTVNYSINAERVDQLFLVWRDYVFGTVES